MSEGTHNLVATPEQLAELLRQQAAEQAHQASVEAASTPQGAEPLVSAEPMPPRPSQPLPDALRSVEDLKRNPAEPWTMDLEDGRTITLQKPAKATTLHIAKVLGVDSNNPGLSFYFNVLMWVRKVSTLPAPVPFMTTRQQFEALHELLGDDALEEVAAEVHSQPRAVTDKAELGKS